MPIIFIHGVNTRIDESYHRQRLALADSIDKLLKPKLPAPYSKLEVVAPYWGDFGSSTGSSIVLPKAAGGSAEAFGSAQGSAHLETYDELLDTLLSAWTGLDEATSGVGGDSFAVVAEMISDLRQDQQLREAVSNVKPREEALAKVEDALFSRLRSNRVEDAGNTAESYGLQDKLAHLRTGLSELLQHPVVRRPLSVTAASRREWVHNRFALFLGDVFVYLKQRGTREQPGPIIEQVLRAFTASEPTLVVTHSMGGNIFYDIATHFRPEMRIDAWLSVASQVGFLEYQRLFLRSEKARFTGEKVAKPIAGPWLNVFDPIDPFAFLAAPVFRDVLDFEFVTGSNIFNAHSDYFIREKFYERAGTRLGELLQAKAT